MPRTLRHETALARTQRAQLTLPEILLWQQLRARKLGPKFRRQHPVGPYVVDFYCPEARLIVEVDGDAHSRGDRPVRDCTRDAFLIQNGYRLHRVSAADVLAHLDSVLSAIAALAATPLHQPAAGPPPRTGEDLAQGA